MTFNKEGEMGDKVDLIGIEDVMKMLGIGRVTATRLLNTDGCPTLPRKKGSPYLVEKEAFVRWLTRRS